MARLDTYTCDEPGCLAIKKEANHWWDVREVMSDGRPTLEIQEHQDSTLGRTFCGIEHAAKFVSQWMASLSDGK